MYQQLFRNMEIRKSDSSYSKFKSEAVPLPMYYLLLVESIVNWTNTSLRRINSTALLHGL